MNKAAKENLISQIFENSREWAGHFGFIAFCPSY
jgi:hypothetical protein